MECPHCLRAAQDKATCELGRGFGHAVRVHAALEKRAERLSKAAERSEKRAKDALEAVEAEQGKIRARMDSKLATLQDRVASSLSASGMVLKVCWWLGDEAMMQKLIRISLPWRVSTLELCVVGATLTGC